MEKYVQSDAQKEHLEHFKTATLGKVLMINFASICNNLLKHSISVDGVFCWWSVMYSALYERSYTLLRS